MNTIVTASFHRKASALLFAAASLVSIATVQGQTVFTVNSPTFTQGSGAAVTITAPNPLFQNPGTVSNSITPVTFGTDIDFYSPGPSFGASNPVFNFNGSITGSTITAGTTIPISYDFVLGKNSSASDTVTWTLTFFDNVNTTPIVIGSGSLVFVSSGGSATFSGESNYSFTSGSSTSFTASLNLTYSTGLPVTNPDVTISMADSGFGGQGITLNGSAIPEPSAYAALAGFAALGLAMWQRRRQRPVAPCESA